MIHTRRFVFVIRKFQNIQSVFELIFNFTSLQIGIYHWAFCICSISTWIVLYKSSLMSTIKFWKLKGYQKCKDPVKTMAIPKLITYSLLTMLPNFCHATNDFKLKIWYRILFVQFLHYYKRSIVIFSNYNLLLNIREQKIHIQQILSTNHTKQTRLHQLNDLLCTEEVSAYVLK